MRAAIWFVLLFAVAVVAATTLGTQRRPGQLLLGRLARSTCRSTCSCSLLVGACFVLVVGDPGRQLADRACRSARASGARRGATARAGGAARGAGAVLRRPLQPRAEGGAARARDPGRDARAGAGQRVHACSATCSPPAALHRLQDRARRDEQLRRALDLSRRSRGARAPAEEGARLLAAEWALDDRDAPRALELLAELPPGRRAAHAGAAPEAAGGAPGAPAAGGAEDGAPAGQAPGVLAGGGAGPAALAGASSRSTPRTTSISCAAPGCSSTPPTGAIRSSPRAPRRVPRARRAPRRRAAGCGRSGTGSPSSAPRTAQRWRWRSSGASDGIGADWLPRLESALQAFARRPRSRWRPARASPSAQLVGQGAARCSNRRRPTPRSARRRAASAWRALAELARAGGRRSARACSCDRPRRTTELNGLDDAAITARLARL